MTRFTWRGHTSAPSPDNTNTVSLALCFALLLPLLLASGCSSGTSSASTSTAPSSPVKTVTPVSITTNSLPSGTVGTPYSQTIAAVNGTTPYTFGVATGTLPAGLTLSTSGVISGTPTAAGSSTFGIQVTDSSSPAGSATTSFSITVIRRQWPLQQRCCLHQPSDPPTHSRSRLPEELPLTHSHYRRGLCRLASCSLPTE